MDTAQIDNVRRQVALRRVPSLEKALAQVTSKLVAKDAFLKEAKAQAEKKVAAWESLQAQYVSDLKIIADGSFPGYNGKPYGAHPTITEGVIL